MAGSTIEVIIPVRNMAAHLPRVLRPLHEQLLPGDAVTVVDDASTDETAAVARSIGAEVVSLPDSRGPYYARQVAAFRSRADVLLFLDARSRPLPGLVQAHRDMQASEGVALSCTDVRTQTGPTLAMRMAAMAQPFSLPRTPGVPGKPAYYPTANLGVDRIAFERVGGFRHMRSGGDADICWRIQEQSIGTMAIDHRVLMEWEPRETMRELASQWKRYGRGTAYLQWAYRADARANGRRSIDIRRSVTTWSRSVGARVRRPPTEHLAGAALNVMLQWGYVSETFKRREFRMPMPYDLREGGATTSEAPVNH